MEQVWHKPGYFSCFIYWKPAKSERNPDIYHKFSIMFSKQNGDREILAFLHIYSKFCVTGQEKVDEETSGRGGGGQDFPTLSISSRWSIAIFPAIYSHRYFFFARFWSSNKLSTPLSCSAKGPWNKSSNFIFPTKYGIPKSLSRLAIGWVSHFASLISTGVFFLPAPFSCEQIGRQHVLVQTHEGRKGHFG